MKEMAVKEGIAIKNALYHFYLNLSYCYNYVYR